MQCDTDTGIVLITGVFTFKFRNTLLGCACDNQSDRTDTRTHTPASARTHTHAPDLVELENKNQGLEEQAQEEGGSSLETVEEQ